jgi:hypothetical protein
VPVVPDAYRIPIGLKLQNSFIQYVHCNVLYFIQIKLVAVEK